MDTRDALSLAETYDRLTLGGDVVPPPLPAIRVPFVMPAVRLTYLGTAYGAALPASRPRRSGHWTDEALAAALVRLSPR
jgi:hypothetical protein